MDPYFRICQQQSDWAKSQDIAVDDHGYTRTVDENLLQPMHPLTGEEFSKGAGDELTVKMRALHSSSELVCNVFDYWRHQSDLHIAARACGMSTPVERISFERTFPTGMRGTPPHLDVVLEGRGQLPWAIESKFLEPYTPHKEMNPVYAEHAELWDELADCRALAQDLLSGHAHFQFLNAGQLLTHTIGLARQFGPKGYVLLYLWYDVGGNDGTAHRRNIEEFASRVGTEVHFEHRTHQELFFGMKGRLHEHQEYERYLGQRYFSDAP